MENEPEEDKKKENLPKKKVRKVNKADLKAMYVNSRNFTVALKTERQTRLRVQDLDPLTGKVI